MQSVSAMVGAGELVTWPNSLGQIRFVSSRVPNGVLYSRRGLYVCMPGRVCQAFCLAYAWGLTVHDVCSFVKF